MKKIMKKVISLALAVVMMLTLAPMTSKAAIDMGAGTDQSPYEMGQPSDTTLKLESFMQSFFVYNTWDMELGAFDVTVKGEGAFAIGAWNSVTGDLGNPSTSKECTDEGTITINSIAHPRSGMGIVCFYIVNLNDAGSGVYDVTVEVSTGGAGGVITGDGSLNDPFDLTNALDNVPALEYNQSAFYKVTGLVGGEEYKITVNGGMMDSYTLYDSNEENPVYSMSTGRNTSATITLTAHPRTNAVAFMIANTNRGPSGPFKVTVEPVGDPTGSEYNPDGLVIMDDYQDITLSSSQNRYYYTWLAEEEGYLTIEFPDGLNASTGWTCSIAEENFKFPTKYIDTSYNGDSDPETEYENPIVVGVKAGERVNMFIAALDYAPGTVYYKATFEEDIVERVEEVDPSELFTTITEYDELFGEEFPVYQLYKEAVVSTGTFPLGSLIGFPTLYGFSPEKAGIYEITVSNGKIGLYGFNTSNLTDPSDAIDSVEVTIENVGQTAYIGVTDTAEGASEVTLTITLKEEIEDKPVSTVYEDAWFEGASPEPYTFTGDVDELEFINIDDKVDDFDKNVYPASDGFYHFGSTTGPVILVDLDGLYDWINPLASAKNNSLKGMSVNGKGWDYSELYQFFEKIADQETKLYPLNDYLIGIFMDAGQAQGWYNESVGGITTADGWMFNCCYIPAKEVTPEGDSGSGESEKQPEKEPVKVEVPADKVITESVLDEKIEEAVANNAPLVVETTTEGVTLTFAPADLKDAEAVKLNVEVKLDVDVKDETVAKNDDITADNFVLKVEFSHDGKLPAKATITIPVPAKFANKTLFYYEILADGTLKFVCDAPVDADGNAKVTQDHCSDYVLLTEKVAEAPKTGDNTNFALWIAVLGLGVVAITGSVVMKKREF